jgi:diguanylate cyclase (GGDEF)-like protein
MDSFDKYDGDVKFPPLIDQYEKKIYDLQQLIEISKGLNSTLDYNILIDSILLTCMGQLQLINAGIFLQKVLGSEKFSLHRNYKGFDLDHSIEYAFGVESDLVKLIEDEYRCYTFNEIISELMDGSAEILGIMKPDILVPLQSKGEINGIIMLGNRISHEPFTEAETEYLLNIASLAGIAINNARLYEMATTDMMTKLKIHHYFQTILIEEINRSMKYDRPLSLIMADIDNFKVFNDEYGHIAGDEILKNIALILKNNIRLIDIGARYGGEEFAVILPKTDINEAIIVAERIRSSVESSSLTFNEEMLNVTISVGVSQFDPMIDHNKHNLINRADKALCNSKKDGRNRVSFL